MLSSPIQTLCVRALQFVSVESCLLGNVGAPFRVGVGVVESSFLEAFIGDVNGFLDLEIMDSHTYSCLRNKATLFFFGKRK